MRVPNRLFRLSASASEQLIAVVGENLFKKAEELSRHLSQADIEYLCRLDVEDLRQRLELDYPHMQWIDMAIGLLAKAIAEFEIALITLLRDARTRKSRIGTLSLVGDGHLRRPLIQEPVPGSYFASHFLDFIDDNFPEEEAMNTPEDLELRVWNAYKSCLADGTITIEGVVAIRRSIQELILSLV